MAEKILVIDDQIDTLELALTNLEMEGYRVATSLNGKNGLEIALSKPQDVIVLDIMMPGMDGLEVCRRLRKSKKTGYVPILMLTAKAGIEGIINGLKMGATEYLSKPFHIEEFLVRIKTLIRIKKAEDKLIRTNKHLEKLVAERTQKLIEAARFEVLGKMAGSIGHDLSNLLQSIQGQNELAQLYDDSYVIG